MPTYLYETTTDARRFEVRQGFNEPALEVDPATGEPVRRVISGGLGTMLKSDGAASAGPSCGPANCGCGKFN
jgi:predicted nucleic acid-binding Zn ribbon protein